MLVLDTVQRRLDASIRLAASTALNKKDSYMKTLSQSQSYVVLLSPIGDSFSRTTSFPKRSPVTSIKGKIKDLVGQRFGRLVVVSRSDQYVPTSEQNR